MRKRILTAAVLILLSLGVLWLRFYNPLWLALYVNLVCVLAVYEMVRNYKEHLPPVLQGLLVAFAAASYVIFRFAGGFQMVVYGAVLVFLLCMVYVLFDRRCTKETISTSALVLIYPTVVLSVAYVLNAQSNGIFLIVFMILTACLCDTFALFVGMACKGPKLCPAVSPKKTISGAVGGLVGGIAAALVSYYFFTLVLPDLYTVDYPLWQLLIAGFFGALFGEIGDLAESFLKRQLGIKDFSNLLPGHGGVMDRIDSMMFCNFFFFFYFGVILHSFSVI